MTFWPCMVYDGLWRSGCAAEVHENGLVIKWLVIDVYNLRHDQVIKIIKFDKKRDMFRVEYNTGTRKNRIFDLQISFQRKIFINHIEDLGWVIETKERYEREITY